jgi:hypothetical protein
MTRFAALAVAMLAFAVTMTHAQAQTPSATPSAAPAGVISGTVRNGTAGAATPTLSIQLIAVQASGQITAQTQQTSNGAFRFQAPADASVRYVLRTEYAGVPYLSNVPLLISKESPTNHYDLTVWETTTTRPDLRIARTVVSLEGVDTDQHRVQLRRDDVVLNPGDRVYVGGNDHRTLRVPASDGVIAVDTEQAFDATADLDGQVVVTTQPIRPGENTVATRTLATYEPNTTEYALRVIAPLATDSMEVRGPSSLVRSVRATANATGARPVDESGEHWLVARRTGAAREGEGMVVTFTGLGGVQPENPLTSVRGAAIAVGVVLAVLVLASAVLMRVRISIHRDDATEAAT